VELEALQQHHAAFQDLGAELVAISPQLVAKNAEAKAKHGLQFPVLADHGNAYARQLGLVFTLPADLQEVYRDFGIVLPDSNGEDSWQLPVPARIVADRHGVIRSVAADPDYTRRPDPHATLELLRGLA
jgi:peroxiredoxin